MKDNKYNGWANYATWRINLEMFDNFEVAEYFEDRPSVDQLAEHMKETAESYLEETAGKSASLCLSYALAFLSDVDWEEIAENKLEYAEYEKYSVLVGNIGQVYSGYSEEDARQTYNEYAEQSKEEYGRAAGEHVALMFGEDVLEEFLPNYDIEGL
jgi:hypothetical protein